MKKSIFTLAIALVAFSNVAMASTTAVTAEKTSNVENYRGTTPLANAIIKGDVEAVKKFIDYGCDVNERSNGMTPLMLAARYNQAAIIKILIENGANIKHTDDKGQTAMKYAERSNATLAIEALKAAKA
jgi:uncharacterized protein